MPVHFNNKNTNQKPIDFWMLNVELNAMEIKEEKTKLSRDETTFKLLYCFQVIAN